VSDVRLAVLVPVKAFTAAKARLSPVVDAPTRAALARWMATNVIECVRPLPTFVACDDDEVATWADRLGAGVLWGPGLGLNGAVDTGVATIAGKGFDHVVITHGDLPLAEPLPGVAVADTVVIVPDRRRDGTNVLARPCAAAIPASYGGGSFRRHLDAATATGYRVSVRADVRLAIDVDTADDLAHPLVRPVLTPIVAATTR
jgi:2-phospho-L-lactate/phosphoenolpyruvate guanylyltransferase